MEKKILNYRIIIEKEKVSNGKYVYNASCPVLGLADFEKTKPLIIIFQRNYAPWGGDASGYNKFFTDFLDREYVLLKGLSYRFVEPKQGNFDLSEDFNIRKDDAAKIIERLVTKELVKPL